MVINGFATVERKSRKMDIIVAAKDWCQDWKTSWRRRYVEHEPYHPLRLRSLRREIWNCEGLKRED
jgi:hypothetical protein